MLVQSILTMLLGIFVIVVLVALAFFLGSVFYVGPVMSLSPLDTSRAQQGSRSFGVSHPVLW
jgi:hypothetical protein